MTNNEVTADPSGEENREDDHSTGSSHAESSEDGEIIEQGKDNSENIRKSTRTHRPPPRFKIFQCQPKDCGRCRNCRDKPRYGGPNKRKQKCLKPVEANIFEEDDELEETIPMDDGRKI